MQTIQTISPAPGATSIALGCFDGLHAGHLTVLRAALDGKRGGLLPAVFTFGTQEDSMTAVKNAPELTSSRQREAYFASLGFSLLYRIDFCSVRTLSPEAFVRDVLCGTLCARRICCGFNYRFGHGGRGDAAMLKTLGERCGAEVSILPPVLEHGAPVSSSRVRAAVERGDMETAARLLGRPFAIDFPVVHGRQLGRQLGAPTINQPFPEGFILPRFGVYASYAELAGRALPAVTNIGVKPTVGADAPLSETFISGFAGDLYGQRVTVSLLKYLRGEQRFDSLDALRAQIQRDADRSAQIFRREGLSRPQGAK